MAFWQNRSISLVDMYIDNSEPTENVGHIHFNLEYDFENTTLILKIVQVASVFAQNCSVFRLKRIIALVLTICGGMPRLFPIIFNSNSMIGEQ